MAKVNRRNAYGTVNKKNRKSRNQKQKLREKDVEKEQSSTTKKPRSSKARI